MSHECRGVCLMSVPKSGTMFLSRYLEKLLHTPSVFGLQERSSADLYAELARSGWHPRIDAARRAGSADLDAMARRFAKFLARGRQERDAREGGLSLVSDHGFHSFLRFLVNPAEREICDPKELIDWAAQRQLTLIYLHRDIRQIADSLAHFLVAGKSFLVTLQSLDVAADLVSELYAPVLAEQMRQWARYKDNPNVLSVRYEELVANPRAWIAEICRRSAIPYRPEALIESATEYRSWTYRGGVKKSWRTTFSAAQQARLASL